jgi:putative protein kinase ArgK-like GTPase of G3E family
LISSAPGYSGRRDVGDQIRKRLERAKAGRGGTLVFTGPPGVGKSAVLDLDEAIAKRRGWRTGRGTASAVEGPWPYTPVLEAVGASRTATTQAMPHGRRPAGCDVRDAR